MSTTFWGEVVRHSIYILNRVPTRALTGETAYQAWKEEKPRMDHIKVFGCLAHMKIPKVYTKKLDERSKEMVYLGKEPGTKAHRLFDPTTGRVSVSRDVIFEEAKSWDWNQKSESGTDKLGSFIIIDSQSFAGEEQQGEVSTPMQSHTTGHSAEYESESSSGSTEPHRFRLHSDVYNDAAEVDLNDEELLFVGAEEPQNFAQADIKEQWKIAMKNEISAVEKNNTWVLTDLPPGRRAISLKWVYKIKKDANGNIVKYKARIVARGFVQKKGVDFDEVFASVTRLETARLLLALSAKNGWEVHHLDVKTTFLNGELVEEVYVS